MSVFRTGEKKFLCEKIVIILKPFSINLPISTYGLFSCSTENQPGDRFQDPSAEQSRPEEPTAERAFPVRCFAAAALQAGVRVRREQGTWPIYTRCRLVKGILYKISIFIIF